MNHYQKPPQHQSRNSVYRQALERLDRALKKNTPSNECEKIDKLRWALFGELPEDGKKSGTTT
jgi:hypothetical protein